MDLVHSFKTTLKLLQDFKHYSIKITEQVESLTSVDKAFCTLMSSLTDGYLLYQENTNLKSKLISLDLQVEVVLIMLHS